MIKFIKAAVPVSREGPPLFLCPFYWCVLYLHGHLRASSPNTAAEVGLQPEAEYRTRHLWIQLDIMRVVSGLVVVVVMFVLWVI